MQSFLSTTRSRLITATASPNAARVTVLVIGNEAGDLDTVVSSIGAAWALHAQGKFAVPIMPFIRDDLRLRRDVQLVLSRAGISEDHLVFWDDIYLNKEPLPTVGLFLTDHNDPSLELTTRFPGPVVGILDHHSDAGKFRDAADRVVDPGASSACSIVAERVLSSPEKPPMGLVRMLLDTIAVDARAFSSTENRFNARDTIAFKGLVKAYEPEVFNAEAALLELMTERFDVDGLSALDLMKLDYKGTTVAGPRGQLSLGVCAIFDDAPGVCERAGGSKALVKQMGIFAQSKELDCLFLMTKPHPETHTKGLIVHANYKNGQKGIQAVIEQLGAYPSGMPDSLRALPLFQRQGITETGFGMVPDARVPTPVTAFHLANAVTRKTMMPAIVMVLNTAAL